MKQEEKITLMDQHSKGYVDFFIPKGNDAQAHVRELVEKLNKYDCWEILLGLSLDGEAKNTGPNGGILRRLEIILGMLFFFVKSLF